MSTVVRVQALFKKGGAAKKAAPAKKGSKKAAPAPKKSSGARKGWLGGVESINLDKWYGKSNAPPPFSSAG